MNDRTVVLEMDLITAHIALHALECHTRLIGCCGRDFICCSQAANVLRQAIHAAENPLKEVPTPTQTGSGA